MYGKVFGLLIYLWSFTVMAQKAPSGYLGKTISIGAEYHLFPAFSYGKRYELSGYDIKTPDRFNHFPGVRMDVVIGKKSLLTASWHYIQSREFFLDTQFVSLPIWYKVRGHGLSIGWVMTEKGFGAIPLAGEYKRFEILAFQSTHKIPNSNSFAGAATTLGIAFSAGDVRVIEKSLFIDYGFRLAITPELFPPNGYASISSISDLDFQALNKVSRISFLSIYTRIGIIR